MESDRKLSSATNLIPKAISTVQGDGNRIIEPNFGSDKFFYFVNVEESSDFLCAIIIRVITVTFECFG